MFESATEKAEEALRKLLAARTDLEARTKTAETELANLRAGAGEAELAAILENSDAGPMRARAVELDMQLSGLAGARTALMKRLGAAAQDVQRAKAEAIRAEAGKLQKKLDSHLAESIRLRKALENHEGGCPFVPRAEALQAIMAANPGIPLPADAGFLKWPASKRMVQEINALLAKAAATEQTRAEAHSVATGSNLEELLAACGDNPMAPAEAELRAVFAEAEAAAIAGWERHIRGDFALGTGPRSDERVTAYVIAWADGRVDRQHSSWQNSRRAERFDASKPKPAPRLVTREVA